MAGDNLLFGFGLVNLSDLLHHYALRSHTASIITLTILRAFYNLKLSVLLVSLPISFPQSAFTTPRAPVGAHCQIVWVQCSAEYTLQKREIAAGGGEGGCMLEGMLIHLVL